MPTPEQQALIDAISSMLQADQRIEAAWLSGSLGGSLGEGGADAWSDVDILALAADGQRSALSRDYLSRVHEMSPCVLVRPLFEGRVISCVTEDWRRFDISFVEGADLARYDAAKLKTLFNRGDRSPPRIGTRPYQPSQETLDYIFTEFLRVLSLASVVVGRRDYVNALSGVDQLRRMTMNLMLEVNRVHPAERGGALHMNRLLTPDQFAELAALPPLAADRDSIIQGHVVLARIFLPLARELAAEVGADWPEAFETATRRHLKARLGVDI